MDYELLNKVKGIGILGCIISLLTYTALQDLVRGKIYTYAIGNWVTGDVLDYWNIASISQLGTIFLVSIPITAIGVFASIPLYRKNVHRAITMIVGTSAIIATIVIARWVIPYGTIMWEEGNSTVISESLVNDIPTIELLWSQSMMALLLFLFIAGVAGIVTRKSDRIALAGYVLTFLGGLASLAIAIAGSTALLPGLGGVDWIPLASTISLVCYAGLIPAFYRPITQSEEHSDTEEQESDSRT